MRHADRAITLSPLFQPSINIASLCAVPAVLSCALIPLIAINMALFHTLIELVTIIIGMMSFVVVWNSFPLSKNTTLLFLGCGYFWVSGLDLIHALSFEGLALIPSYRVDSTQQVWLLARFLEALVLLVASFAGKRELMPIPVMLGLGIVSVAMFLVQYNDFLPVMFVEGEGLTAVKIWSEYLIIAVLLASALGLYCNQQLLGSINTRLMILSVVLTILAELNFTLYSEFYDWPIVLGHVLKVFSFWLIYRVLVQSSLHQPMESLFHIIESYDSASDETLIIDQHGEILRANRKLQKSLGQDPTGLHCHAVFHDSAIAQEACSQCQAISGEGILNNFEYFCRQDQEWYESSLSTIHFGERFRALMHNRRCISKRKKAEQQVASLNKLYQVLSQANKAIVEITEEHALFRKICEIAVEQGEFKMAWIGIIDGAIVRPDHYAGEETGYLNEMQMRVDDSDLAKGPVGTAAKTKQVACVNSVSTDPNFSPWRAAAEERGYKALAAVPIKTGKQVIGIFTLYSHIEAVFDAQMLALLSSLSDDLSKAYRNIQLNNKQQEADSTIRKLSSAIEQGMNSVLISNTEGVIEYVNAGFVQLSGYSAEEVIGRDQSQFQSAIKQSHVYDEIWKTVVQEGSWLGEVRNLRKDGSVYWTILSVSCIRNSDGDVTQYLWSSADNTKLHEAQETINKLAFYDPLTGLANRRLLMDRLEHAVARAKREGESVALMMCDLDNFKMINDSLGHDAGDELLKHIAKTMKSVIREDDLVARLGGDEFVILLDGISESGDIIAVASALLQGLEQPLELLTHRVAVSSSVGIAMYPEDGLLPSDLLRNADLAMYYAKDGGKNRFQFYQAEMNEKAQGRLRLEHRLRQAIENQDFELWYQPQVKLSDNQIVGFEALIRWREGDILIPPNDFIPLAEETGMIEQMGDWVLRQAHQDWLTLEDYFPECSMAVNVSAYQFRKSEQLIEVIKTLLAASKHLPSEHFIIELTESTLTQDVDATIGTLNRLKALGVSLSIDDFGTGYSSLSRLKQFPLDQLKIDRSFIKDLLKDENDKAIVAAIIAIAQELDLKLVAEGVELPEQAESLLNSGCAFAQGFRYYKPMPLADLLSLKAP